MTEYRKDFFIYGVFLTYEGSKSALKGVQKDLRNTYNFAKKNNIRFEFCTDIDESAKDTKTLLEHARKFAGSKAISDYESMILMTSSHGFYNKESLICGINLPNGEKAYVSDISNQFKNIKRLYVLFDGCMGYSDHEPNDKLIKNQRIIIMIPVEICKYAKTSDTDGSYFTNAFLEEFQKYINKEEKYKDIYGEQSCQIQLLVPCMLTIIKHFYEIYKKKYPDMNPQILANKAVRDNDILFRAVLVMINQRREDAMITKVNNMALVNKFNIAKQNYVDKIQEYLALIKERKNKEDQVARLNESIERLSVQIEQKEKEMKKAEELYESYKKVFESY